MLRTDPSNRPERPIRLSPRDVAALGERIEGLHAEIRRFEPAVDRMACALYDPVLDQLDTIVDSVRGGLAPSSPGSRFPLSPGLAQLARTGTGQTVDDLPAAPKPLSGHEQWRHAQCYRSSYTLPLLSSQRLEGFLFFDSTRPALFQPAVTHQLGVYGRLVAMMISLEVHAARSLSASVRIACELALLRDVETGAHLERMSHYCRVIARALAPGHGLGDGFCEHVFLFSPLHDIGKIGIADALLRKHGRLSADERDEMKTHVVKGIEIVERMVRDTGHRSPSGVDVLRNLVAGHHEYLDGSGYPHGWRAGQIPLEARIATVADIFDALSSRRSYKEAWPLADTFARLDAMVDEGKIDAEGVHALKANADEVGEIARLHLDG